MGASRWQIFRWVIFPHMIPTFFAGMRLGMAAVLLGVLLAELYVSTTGIGYFTQLFTQAFDPTKLLGLVSCSPRWPSPSTRSCGEPRSISAGGGSTSRTQSRGPWLLRLDVGFADHDAIVVVPLAHIGGEIVTAHANRIKALNCELSLQVLVLKRSFEPAG